MNKVEKVKELLLDSYFNGVVLIEKDEEVLLKEGFGYANYEHDIPMSCDSVLRIASLTKQFTATMILLLEESGMLSVNDALSKYIDDYPRGDEITIHHLLTHTSGVPNFDIEYDFFDVLKSNNVLDALIGLFKYESLDFNPGEKFSYSISGYLLLTFIIEKVSDLSYDAFLKKNIVDKLGLIATEFDYATKIIKNRSGSYRKHNGEIVNDDFIDMRIAGGGGGLLSSLNDMYKWQKGLLAGNLVSEKSLGKMYGKQYHIEGNTYAGYGIFTVAGEPPSFFHAGGGNGVRAMNVFFPEEKVHIILISNVNDRDTFNRVYEGIKNVMID